MGSPRIGIHLSTSGGVYRAAERAHEIGANTFQIFSASPRMWRATMPTPADCERLSELRRLYDCAPLVIHVSYLVNLCSQSTEVKAKSITAFRGEVERALALGAQYLVLHPGSWRGLTRDAGLTLAAESIAQAVDGIDLAGQNLGVLIENTAGAEFSLGGSFEQVAQLIARLKASVPVGACLDTCHCHVAGYDLVTSEGYEETVALIKNTIGLDTVRVWHMNDAKAPRGSKLDRHQNIGEGTIGLNPFRRLLNDRRFRHCAFIAETPVDEPDDDMRNVHAMKKLLRNREKPGAQGKVLA
jgi:deoxyribonuclease-4